MNPGYESVDCGVQQRSYSGALVVPLVMVPFLASVDVGLGRKEWTTISPIVACSTVCGTLSLAACALYPRHVMAAMRAGSGLLLGFTVLAVLAVVGELHAASTLFREESKDALLPLASTLVVFAGLTISAFCRDDARWRFAAFCSMVLLVGSIYWDSQYPGTFSFLMTRAAGLGINPNSGAAFSVLALLACLDWRANQLTIRTLALMAFAGSGVFLTLSRSGLLTWLFVCGFYAWRAMKREGAKTLVLLLGGGMALSLYAATASDWLRESVPMLAATTARLETFLGDGNAMSHADDTRVHLMQDYFEFALERPWFGWGNGFLLPGEDCNAHNIFLHKWVQHGIVALIATALLIKSTYSLGGRLGSTECQAVAGFIFVQAWFTHNLFDDRSVLLTWAILVGRAGCRVYDLRVAANAARKRDAGVPTHRRQRIDRGGTVVTGPHVSERRPRPTRLESVPAGQPSAVTNAADMRNRRGSSSHSTELLPGPPALDFCPGHESAELGLSWSSTTQDSWPPA